MHLDQLSQRNNVLRYALLSLLNVSALKTIIVTIPCQPFSLAWAGTNHFSPCRGSKGSTAYITLTPSSPNYFDPENEHSKLLRNIGNIAHCHAVQNPKNRINIKISVYRKSSHFTSNFTYPNRKKFRK
jgi:hypothetical protein